MSTIWVYVAFAADDINEKIDAASRRDDPEQIRRLGQVLDIGNEIWRSWSLSHGGDITNLAAGGGRIRIGADWLGEVPELKKKYGQLVESGVSIGIGAKVSEADKALKAARIQGGDQIVLYAPEVEDVLARAENSVAKTEEDTSFDFGANVAPEAPALDTSGHAEGLQSIARMRPENRKMAMDFYHYAIGKTPERPVVTDDMERHLARFGIVDPKGYAFGEDGRSLHRPLPGPRRKGRGEEPRDLNRFRLMNQGRDPGYVKGELEKASKEPALNSPAAGGGITGPSQQPATAPAEPVAEGSEHSEAEAAQSQIEDAPRLPEGTHAAADLHDQFHAQADGQQQQEGDSGGGDIKSEVVQILKVFKEKAPELEQLQGADPEMYKALTGMVQSMIVMAQQLFGGAGDQQGDAEVQKSEDLEKGDVVDLNPPAATGKKFRAKAQVYEARHEFARAREQAHADRTPEKKPVVSAIFGRDPSHEMFRPGDRDIYDYSEHLSPQQQQAGYELHIHSPAGDNPNSAGMIAQVSHKGHILHDTWALPHFEGNAGDFNVHSHPGSEAHGGVGLFSPAFKTALDAHAKIMLHQQAQARLNPRPTEDEEPEESPEPEPPEPRPSHLKVIKAEARPCKWRLGERRCQRLVTTGYCHDHKDHWANKIKQKEAKAEELAKEGLNPGKTGKHNVVLPVGSQIDAGADGTREVGQIKVQDPETGATKWRSVRSGIVMDSKGNPISSRNPGG